MLVKNQPMASVTDVNSFISLNTHVPNTVEGLLIPTAVQGVFINPNCVTEDLKNLPHIAINRDFRRRLQKMMKPFSKALKGQQIFVVFRVNQVLQFDIGGETIIVQPGLYLADGNTRLESMRVGNIPTPDSVICFVFDIDSEEDYLEEYYAIDNSQAAEVTADKIRGAVSFLNLNVRSKVAVNGSFSWALKNAFPHDAKEGVLEKVAYFKNEIEFLDDCGIFMPTERSLGTQNFYMACLIAAKFYSQPPSSKNALKKVFESLARLDFDDLMTHQDKWNGVTALIYQVCRPEKKQWYDPKHGSSTKFDATIPVVSFFLYCIQLQMQNKLLDKTQGFKPAHWGCGPNAQKGTDLYSEMLKDLQTNFPM